MDLRRLKFAVLGGDTRQGELCRILRKKGCFVSSYGLKNEADTGDWQRILKTSDCLLLPLPLTRDGIRLFADAGSENAGIRLDLIAKAGVPYLFGGKMPESFRRKAEAAGSTVFDYFDSEWLQVKNALATAEGALSLAMQELPVTIDGSKIVVTGYGRIGRILVDQLISLGAIVTVFERREDRHAWISLAHAKPKFFYELSGKSFLSELPTDYRVIFNTVPERIFVEEFLDHIPQSCLFIDLASPPGGIDMTAATAKGIRVLWATALPGKYAPESAAYYLLEVVRRRLEDLMPNG